jgi:hypothetical protein
MHGGAELVNEPRRLGLARCILKAADGRLRSQRSAALWTAPNCKLHQGMMSVHLPTNKVQLLPGKMSQRNQPQAIDNEVRGTPFMMRKLSKGKVNEMPALSQCWPRNCYVDLALQ